MSDEESKNLGNSERVASALIGSLFVLRGFDRKSFVGAALAAAGVMLIKRAASGHCPVYAAMGVQGGQIAPAGRTSTY